MFLEEKLPVAAQSTRPPGKWTQITHLSENDPDGCYIEWRSEDLPPGCDDEIGRLHDGRIVGVGTDGDLLWDCVDRVSIAEVVAVIERYGWRVTAEWTDARGHTSAWSRDA